MHIKNVSSAQKFESVALLEIQAFFLPNTQCSYSKIVPYNIL
jgi:hypothetical protein